MTNGAKDSIENGPLCILAVFIRATGVDEFNRQRAPRCGGLLRLSGARLQRLARGGIPYAVVARDQEEVLSLWRSRGVHHRDGCGRAGQVDPGRRHMLSQFQAPLSSHQRHHRFPSLPSRKTCGRCSEVGVFSTVTAAADPARFTPDGRYMFNQFHAPFSSAQCGVAHRPGANRRRAPLPGLPSSSILTAGGLANRPCRRSEARLRAVRHHWLRPLRPGRWSSPIRRTPLLSHAWRMRLV
jgi:hypothetical protein